MKSEGGFSYGRVLGALPLGVSRALDFILPPTCFGCAVEVEVQGGLCTDCWSGLRFIAEPCCASCGFPFQHDMPEGVLCATCHHKEPRFDAARAAFAYSGESRPLVLSFKYSGRTEGLKTMARWLKTAGADFIDDVDLILPVPLHPFRLIKRKFNQSALLATALSEQTGKPTDPFALKRIKNTKTQGGLSKNQRHINVRAAFAVPEKKKKLIKGKAVLLVDDVYTTGATVENCTITLQKAGARAIYVLTLARVIEPGKPKIKRKKKNEKS